MDPTSKKLLNVAAWASVAWMSIESKDWLQQPDSNSVSTIQESPLNRPPDTEPAPEPQPWYARVSNQTLGGVAVWGDERFFHDWRIQRNALTGHCRLLDGDNVRHAWGTFDECEAALETIRVERRLPPMSGRAVVLIHGLGAIRATMSLLASDLRQQGYQVFNVTYPSTRGDLQQHARALAKIVSRLDGIEEIHFVGHSMGNIVIRCYLGSASDSGAGRLPDPRIKRVVMIAPPNHGAAKAEAWGDNILFVAATGAAGRQLGVGWKSIEPKLAVPPCEFGIIAGGRGNGRGFSYNVPGDDDGLLSVATTRLVGASDFALVPSRHTFLLFNSTTRANACRFLADGCFRSLDEREPIRPAGVGG
jgi:pimeloyl-ACP methyl ester carboxylesterase